MALAVRRAWLCDDAFISFRYVQHLIGGHGLVFNLGERVEGYSNFLWVLWCALGMKLGVTPERWSIVWGILCYGACLALLARRAPAAVLPLAALTGAMHIDWSEFATSGLETSLFTLLGLGGYLCLCRQRRAWAGLLFALATLTRPDGALFFVAGALHLLVTRQARHLLAYAAPFVIVAGSHLLWRESYYGHFLPNTFYAKSADRTWYAQGLVYLQLYFERYWALALALPLAVWARHKREVTLAALLAAVYTLGVVRVGGDFMFARLLIPATPFFLILVEEGVAAARPRAAPFAVLVLMLGCGLTPSRVTALHWVSGIANEREAYRTVESQSLQRARADGATLRRFFAGLPVRMCFFGGQARLVYYSEVAVAIECETGLTDARIAHQPLERRGRVGHEKKPGLAYLIDEREVELMFPREAGASLGFDRWLPDLPILVDGLKGRVLTWNPILMAGLRERGARFRDLPEQIDALTSLSAEEFFKLEKVYFEHVDDPARRARVRALVSR
jgi:hypothetical protein